MVGFLFLIMISQALLVMASPSRPFPSPVTPPKLPLKAGYLVHNGFALLDVMGPAQALNFPTLNDLFSISYVGVDHDFGKKIYKSSDGTRMEVDYGLLDVPKPLDLLIIPGGGTRPAENATIVSWATERAKESKFLFSICTGAALLAKTGALDGKKATTNKVAFTRISKFGPNVKWVKQARWVVQGNIITTSGVAAGIDGAFELIAMVGGKTRSDALANFLEINRARNSHDDPFTKFLDSTTLLNSTRATAPQ